MKKIICILAISLFISNFLAFAYAQSDFKEKLKALKPKDYPTEAIELVVVYPAGGGMDVTARVLAKYLEKYIDNRVIVINKTGGGGLIGHTYLATQAKNDGYTVALLANLLFYDSLVRAKGKWTYKDFEPLAYVNDEPRVWIVNTPGPLKDKTIKDVIQMAKEKPETLKVGVTAGAFTEFIVQMVEMASGAKFIKVPFAGGKPSVIALLGGHIDVSQPFLAEFKGNLEAGQVKIIAHWGAERYHYFPEVPTFNEVLGADNMISIAWRFAAVPKGVPRDRFKYLEAAIDAALHDPECIEEFEKTTGTKIGIKYLNAEQTAQMMEKLYKADVDILTMTGQLSK